MGLEALHQPPGAGQNTFAVSVKVPLATFLELLDRLFNMGRYFIDRLSNVHFTFMRKLVLVIIHTVEHPASSRRYIAAELLLILKTGVIFSEGIYKD